MKVDALVEDGSTVQFSVPLVLADTPEPIPNSGWAIANVDPLDDEGNRGDNYSAFAVRLPQSGADPSGNPVNLFFTYMKPELTSGQITNLRITVGLKSGHLQGDPILTFETPYLTRLSPSLLQPLPANTTIVFNPSNAGPVPQIALTRINRTLLNVNLLGLLGEVTLNFPLRPTSADGAPTRYGRGIVVPDPNTDDFDPEPTVALSGIATIQTS